MSAISWLAEKEALLCPPRTPYMTYLMFSMTIFFRKSSLFVLILISSHCHCRALTNCRLTDQQAASNFHSFHPITEAELKATILKSKPTSCSLDPLPTSLLLEFIDELLPTFTNIINFSLSSGTFPSTFRSAVVKPLLKKASLDQNNLKKLPACFQPLF